MNNLKYICEKYKLMFIFLSCFIISSNIYAVTYTMGTSGSQSATITATSGAPDKFYDNGGSGSNYSDDVNATYVFNCAAGKYVRFKVNTLTTSNSNDQFYVYDGATTSDRLLGTRYNYGTNSPYMYVSSSGSLTVNFISNGCCLNDVGWDIDIWIDNYPGQLWDGSSSTETSTGANWEGDVVPYWNLTSIYIPSGLTNYPVQSNSSNPLDVFDITIASGATFTYSTSASGHSLFVYGNINIGGTFTHSGNYYVQCEGGTSGSYATVSGSGTFTTMRIDIGYNRLAYYKLLNSSTCYDFYLDNANGNSIFDMNTYNLTTYFIGIESSTTFYQRTGTLSMEEDSPTIDDASFTEATGTTSFSSGTVWSSVGQTIPAITYYNLTTAGSGTKTLAGTTPVTGALTVNASTTLSANSRTMTMTGTSTIGGTLTISTGTVDANSTFDATGGTVTFTGAGNLNLGGAVTSIGTFTESTSTVTYDYAGSQSVDADDYYNLTFTSAGTKTALGTTTVGATLTVNSTATFDVNSRTVTITGTSTIPGTLSISTGTVDANSTFNATGGSVTFTGAGNLYLGGAVTSIGTFTEGTSTITYDYAGAQTVASDTYYNLSTAGSGAKTLAGAIVVSGNVNLSGGTLTQSTYAINVAGNWTSSGDYYTEGTGTVTFDGTGTSTVSGTTATVVGSTGVSLLTESFENAGSIPTGWGQEIVTDAGTDPNLTFVTSSSYPTGFTPSLNSYFVRFNSYNASSTGQSRLKRTTSFSSSGYTNVVVNFDWTKDDQYSSANDYINVQYSTNGSTWTTAGSAIYRYSASGDAWSSQSITLPAGAENQATLYIAFLFTSAYGNDCHLDNVRITGDVSETYVGEAFNKFAIAKTGAGAVTLSSKVMVQTSLTFTGGIITSTTSYYPEFDEDATVAGTPSTTCHVNGTVLKRTNTTTKFTFPTGNGTKYRSFAVTPAGTGATIWTLKYFGSGHSDTDVDGSGLNHISHQEYWTCDRSGGAPVNGTLEVTWESTSAVSDYTKLKMAHYDGSTDWDMLASSAVGTNSSGTLTTSAAASSFSPFTIGTTDGVNALPISLTSFTGIKSGTNNELKWSTSSEINNDYFTIEKTLDGTNFETVGTEKGAGNSNLYLEYSMIDYNVREVVNYYRLKQTDFDGKYDFSEIVAIDNRTNLASKEISIITNLLGQEVNEFYRGVVIILYSDGTSIKVIQ